MVILYVVATSGSLNWVIKRLEWFGYPLQKQSVPFKSVEMNTMQVLSWAADLSVYMQNGKVKSTEGQTWQHHWKYRLQIVLTSSKRNMFK